MKAGIKDILGKTIASVIVANNTNLPSHQVFLVFSDGTFFEFWGEQFSCAGGIRPGNAVRAAEYAESMGAIVKIYPIA